MTNAPCPPPVNTTTIKHKLTLLSADILAPGVFHDRLAPAVMAFADTLFDAVNLDGNDADSRESVYTDHGKAIGPFWAALCVREVIRTQRFCRGLYKAVKQASTKQVKPQPVHVVYAGTGPFATLALPVMLNFSPQQVQFTLLEINNESLNHLKKLIDLLELNSHVRSFELCDASLYQLPNKEVDIVISETMNYALLKEPQINIMLNMVQQLAHRDVAFIPQAISVGIAKNHSLVSLCNLYTFNIATYHKIIKQSANQQPWVFDETDFRYSPDMKNNLVYTTSIVVFDDEELNHPDCSLNLPQKVRVELPDNEATVRFKYHDGTQPGFAGIIVE